MGSRSGSTDCRIYVGNLPPDIRVQELDDLFYKFGNIRHIDLKNRRGAPYAFVDFEDYRDADDAVNGRNNYNFDGHRLKVERPRQSATANNNNAGRSNYVKGRPGPPSQRSNYRVIIEGLPSSGSWQDLKDHMREAGDVCYADVYRDGSGVVEFTTKEDMELAVERLDDTKFRSHEGDTAYITVKKDRDNRRSRSPQRSRNRSRRSPSYSPRRSVSRSRSPRGSKRSRSRSRS